MWLVSSKCEKHNFINDKRRNKRKSKLCSAVIDDHTFSSTSIRTNIDIIAFDGIIDLMEKLIKNISANNSDKIRIYRNRKWNKKMENRILKNNKQ